METETKASQVGKPQRLIIFLKSRAGWFVFYYVICFLVDRFDITRNHAFQHPMPTSKAAWVAVPYALLITLLVEVLFRIRNR
jgi:hypothetical protein